MKRKYIQLPKGYMSYSQLNLWLNNPYLYEKIYFDGRDEYRTSNQSMEYGKIVADALEMQQDTDDVLTDAAMLLLPKYDVRDKEIRVDMKTLNGYITLLAKPDSFNSKTKSFLEYKTGKIPWTKDKAQNHLQMHFYAVVIYLIHKTIPENCSLIWIETEQTRDGIKPTGKIEHFPVVFTIKTILDTMKLIATTAQDIEIAWAYHPPYEEKPF